MFKIKTMKQQNLIDRFVLAELFLKTFEKKCPIQKNVKYYQLFNNSWQILFLNSQGLYLCS